MNGKRFRGWVVAALALAMGLGAGCRDELEGAVLRAMAKLASADELVVRAGVEELYELTDATNILLSVPALEAVLDDGLRHDLYTRSLVPITLARIAETRHAWPHAHVALARPLELVFASDSEIVRSQCAIGLGLSGWEQIRDALETCSLTDGSVLVKAAAAEALSTLDAKSGRPGHGPPPGKTPGPPAGPKPPALAPPLAGLAGPVGTQAGQTPCISAQALEALKSHVIPLGFNLDQDLPLCPP